MGAVRPLRAGDGAALAAAFGAIGWSKPESLFSRYLAEQEREERWVAVASVNDQPVGYVTLKWEAEDPKLRDQGIPEIMDLNVLPDFRRMGVATELMTAAENEARKRTARVGIRVGLHSGYGAAQRLYVSRGYEPDGSGAVRDGIPVAEGASVPLDDDTTIRMTLELDG